MKFLIKIICLFLPLSSWRKRLRKWSSTEPPLFLLKFRYKKKIWRLRKATSIKVAFLVTENAKWNGDSLYKEFLARGRFKPQIFVLSKNLKDFMFFKTRGYETKQIRTIEDIHQFGADVLFYDQPWFVLEGEFAPYNLSKFMVLFYLHYAVSNKIFSGTFIGSVCKNFWKQLYMHFVFTNKVSEELASVGICNTLVTGHPKLDAYATKINNNPWRHHEKYKVIYAPHHSFEAGSLQFATFQWNGKYILEMARKRSQTTEWIFKPHPRFKTAVVCNTILNEDEVEEYYASWREIGQVYEEGDYFDMFRTSNLLITDCGSFLTEYLPTGNPVIHLLSSGTYSEPFAEHYYKIKNLQELEDTFNMLVGGIDPLKSERIADASSIKFNSAKNIVDYIEQLF